MLLSLIEVPNVGGELLLRPQSFYLFIYLFNTGPLVLLSTSLLLLHLLKTGHESEKL